MKVELFGSTDVGMVRDHNEDNFVLCRDVAASDWSFKRGEQFEIGELGAVLFVADGMGGTNAGEVASEIAQATIREIFSEVHALPGKGTDNDILKFLKDAIVTAHEKIVYKGHENPTFAGMGTTAVLAWVFKDAVFVAWSGDSRMYIYRDDVDLYPVTDDHSMVWDLVLKGQLTPEEARIHEASNIITQSLGDESRPPKPDARKYDLHQGDRVMLCSDGLCGMLSDNMMYGLLSSRLDTAQTCRELIAAANQAGGTDNITVLVLDVLEGIAAMPVKKTPNTGQVATRAGSGGSGRPVAAAESGGNNNTRNIALVVVAVVVIAIVAFFMLKDGGTTAGTEPGDTDSTATNIDTTATAPVETTDDTPGDVPGESTGTSSDDSPTETPPANTTTNRNDELPTMPKDKPPVQTQPPASTTTQPPAGDNVPADTANTILPVSPKPGGNTTDKTDSVKPKPNNPFEITPVKPGGPSGSTTGDFVPPTKTPDSSSTNP